MKLLLTLSEDYPLDLYVKHLRHVLNTNEGIELIIKRGDKIHSCEKCESEEWRDFIQLKALDEEVKKLPFSRSETNLDLFIKSPFKHSVVLDRNNHVILFPVASKMDNKESHGRNDRVIFISEIIESIR
ncbi:hypothetical protein Lsai_0916 [Legionella sainthelensi]|uniref:Uncharacterized protein n=1 Tax=Legionella sainthelensi TaxID=28087 RepID=A0A0W0YN66_9GAMM|nr:hypothetical protein [Legionella sainthelensi]KTD58309.1 hypothetical protein Lsai_0916 [Legionella sainthelensi]VEH27138.1 Uncharacterised protein [Legionella sainthelensi]